MPLVRTHGFTREALSRSVLALPKAHPEPLRETAVSALFGEGDDARRTLINAWLSEGVEQMRVSIVASGKSTVRDVLKSRLRYNEPMLGLLPEVSKMSLLLFVLHSQQRRRLLPLPPLQAFTL